MNPETRAKFILAAHKHTLQAFGTGGSVWNALTGQSGFQAGNGIDYTTQANEAMQNSRDVQAKQNQLIGQQQGLVGQQQGLASTLSDQMNGRGPNPAQAQFMQNANQIGQQQAGAIASQKGINPALAARLASEQGAQALQGAAGQSATLQAQQQLNATNALQNQQQAIGNTLSATGGTESNIANENQGIYGTASKAISDQNATNAGTDLANAKSEQAGLKGLAGAVPLIGGLFADGGDVSPGVSYPMPAMAAGGAAGSGPKSFVGQYLGSSQPKSAPAPMALGGKVSPQLAAKGGKVKAGPGQKAVKKDNSYDNDKVPALLSEGEIVIPRSIAMHPMAPEMAARFVQATLNKRKMASK